jgi:hypothetical protein
MNSIGRIEKVSFPDLDIESIDAKVDTGAYGTALHVNGISVRNGKLSFWIDKSSNRLEFDKYKVITVRNSFGKTQKRYSILTRLTIGKATYKVYISLTNREDMKYPVLIGRRFLYKFNYIVDVRKKHVNDRIKKG